MALALGLTGFAVVPQAAHAENVYDAFAAWSGRAYVYVAAGETMYLSSAQIGAAYTITRPDGTNAPMGGSATCTVTAVTPCTFSEVATTAGVWAVDRTGGPVVTAALENITPRSASGTDISGRLWLESITLNTGGVYGAAISNFFLLSDRGVQFSVSLPYYQPWGTTIAADSMGITYAGTCTSTYFSVPLPGSYEVKDGIDADDYAPASATCPNYVAYRLFASKPATDMPASASAWADGRTSQTWVYSDYVAPTLTSSFARTSPSGSAGTFTGTLGGQPGTLSVRLDTNNNGSFTDAVDRTLTDVAASVGAYSIAWDGVDGQGAAVSPLQKVAYEVSYTGEAEMHFVQTDTEGRTGGIQITRLNGPGAPDPRVNWDDETALSKRSSDGTMPVPLKGVHVDSSTPVHAWSRGIPTNLAYGWGDQRRIEDWTRVSDATVSAGSIDPVETASIGDLVWNDTNGNGRRDPGEAGFGNVVVTVRDSGGAVAGSARSNSDGFYQVTGLLPGTYTVTIDVPPGYEQTTGPVAVDLGAGEAVTSADFGVRQMASPSVSPTTSPTTSPTSTPTSPATTASATVTASSSPSAAAPGNLAQTGADGWALGALGATLVLGGLMVLGVRRRRH